jgi:hypothetical protein
MNVKASGFILPPFSRKMWVSDRAQQVWEKKFIQFAECWRQVEWLTVVDGIRPCALVWVSQQEFAGLATVLREFRLKAIAVSQRVKEEQNKNVMGYRVVVGSGADLRVFVRAWKRGDDDTIGQLLGYPSCCRIFFHEVFVLEGLTDCTWRTAIQSSESLPENRVIEIRGPPELNTFWISVGVRMTPHFPCRCDCKKASTLAEGFIASGNKAGYGKTMKMGLDVMSWPIEWSSLHGIAEIRTPILKISQSTDATPVKYIVRRLADSFPREGAKGLHFPLRSPAYKSPATSLRGSPG